MENPQEQLDLTQPAYAASRCWHISFGVRGLFPLWWWSMRGFLYLYTVIACLTSIAFSVLFLPIYAFMLINNINLVYCRNLPNSLAKTNHRRGWRR